jgi:hypothetical protein
MMRTLNATVMATAFLLVPVSAFAAEEVSVLELVETAAELAGEEVAVKGELVGDYGFRDDGWMWTQLNGDAYVHEPIREGGLPGGGNTGIGVRMPIDLGEGLDPPGGYRRRGPVVLLSGTWKYHDPERQGESYLEVESLVVIEPGRTLPEKADWMAVTIGVLLIGAAAITWLFRPGE